VEKIGEFLKQFWMFGVVGLVGVGIVGYGLWEAINPEQARVEIIRSDTVTQCHGETCGQIVVDVAGAVEQPGVYKLPSGSRIGDALVSAGGLSASADGEWVASTLNLASEVKDGGKIYIPEKNVNNNQSSIINNQTNLNNQNSKLININTASVSELDSLVGIGEARVQAIINNRPYGSLEELVSKAKIPQSVYDKIKDSLSIY